MAGTIATAVALLLSVAHSASAHTTSKAIQEGCGSGYSLVNDDTGAITTSSGAIWGYIHLTYNGSNGYSCVIVRKTKFHGVSSRVDLRLIIQGSGDHSDFAIVRHWLSVKVYTRSSCIVYSARIWSPARDEWADGGGTTCDPLPQSLSRMNSTMAAGVSRQTM